MLRRTLLLAGLGSFALVAACATSPDAKSDSAEDAVVTGAPNQAVLTLPPMGARPRSNDVKGAPREFAEPTALAITPSSTGVWDSPSPGVRRWRLTIERAGAITQNLGFTRYGMPRGGQLRVLDGSGKAIATFSDKDNKAHGQLWTPVVPGDRITAEVTLPAALVPHLELALTQVSSGFRGLHAGPDERSGDCNVDVVCRDGDDWRSEIRSAAVISLGGSRMCSGTLLNDTAGDGRMFFLTAAHCGVKETNAASLVVYWNYETSKCGGTPDGSLAQFQTGSVFRAGRAASDFTLVELDDAPDPAFNLHWAGWDATDAVPSSATAIHHPETDEKRISFERDPLSVTSYGGNSTPGDGTHLRITDWDVGTTEPGSSGSGIWNAAHRLVGQLHGGSAACGNDLSDWYGWMNKSFDAGATPKERAKDWLDATSTGRKVADGRNGCNQPRVDFTSTPNPSSVGQAVRTTATASGGTGPYTYAWDMNGDGQTDCTDASCSYTFGQETDGNIALTVSDSTGCRTVVRHAQTVTDPGLCNTMATATDVPKEIPDNDRNGVVSTLAVTSDGNARKLKLTLRIEHTYIGDLRVSLIAPSGREVVVHSRTGGTTDNLVLDAVDVPELAGETLKGDWKLKAVDDSSADKGSIVSWKLAFRAPCAP